MTERFGLIREALRERCRWQDNWALSRWGRWRLTAKAVVCLLLAPQRNLWADPDVVEVATYDWHGPYMHPDAIGDCFNWHTLVVPRGWRRWCWHTFWDGNA